MEMSELRIDNRRCASDANGVWYAVAHDGIPVQITVFDVDVALDEVARLRGLLAEVVECDHWLIPDLDDDMAEKIVAVDVHTGLWDRIREAVEG